MDSILCNEEVRVLGCLMEKKMATPEYYPLTLNALVNACNQKSNRDPLTAYDEGTVLQAIDGLKMKQLVSESNVSRATKYEEHGQAPLRPWHPDNDDDRCCHVNLLKRKCEK